MASRKRFLFGIMFWSFMSIAKFKLTIQFTVTEIIEGQISPKSVELKSICWQGMNEGFKLSLTFSHSILFTVLQKTLQLTTTTQLCSVNTEKSEKALWTKQL